MDEPPPTTVVHLKRKGGVVVQGCDVYIGRKNCQGGWKLEQSKWANPFTVKQYGDKAVEMFEEYIRKSPLIDEIEELRHMKLGCWCVDSDPKKSKPCHGNVLIKILNERQTHSVTN